MKNYNAFIEKMREDQEQSNIEQYKQDVAKEAVKQFIEEKENRG